MRNESARQLRGGGSRTLGLRRARHRQPVLHRRRAGRARRRPTRSGLAVFLCNSGQDRGRQSALPRPARSSSGSQGVLITPVDRADPRLALLPRRGTPVVLVDRGTAADHCSVVVDDVAGGDLAADAPARARPPAHRVRRRARVAPPGAPTGSRACAGRTPAAASTPATSWCSRPQRSTVAEGRGRARASPGCPPAAGRRPRSAPTTCSPSGCCRRWCGTGLRVPDDLAIVGYDDIEFAAAAAVPLTSVRQPRQLLGRTAAELLLDGGARARRAAHEHRQVVFDARAGRPRVEPASDALNGGGLMKIALFATCLADALFPDVGQATVRAAGAARPRGGRSRAAQTCCGQMHVNTGYQRRGAAAGAPPRRGVRAGFDVVVAPSGSCVGSVRHQHAMVARRAGDDGAGRAGRGASAARTYELSELLVDVLGVTDVGAYYPHRVTYHPTCHSLRMLRVGDKPLRLLRAVRGHRPGRAARRRPVLRVRRHVRAEERRHLHGDAGRQDAPRASHRRRGRAPRATRPA